MATPFPDLRDRLEQYLHLLSRKNYAATTLRQYRYDLKALVEHLMANGPEIAGPEALAPLVEALIKERSKSPKRFQDLVFLYGSFLRFAGFPEVTAQIPKPRRGRRLPLHPEVKHLKRFLHALNLGPHGFLMVSLASFLYGTGLRISEALALRGEDLIYEDDTPMALRVVGKGNKERLVALSPTARAALLDWFHKRRRGPVFVFPEGPREGKVPSVRYVEQRFADAARAARLKPEEFTPHKLRHAFATLLVEQGADLNSVRHLLGHESLNTTLIYLHTSRRQMQQVVEKLPTLT